MYSRSGNVRSSPSGGSVSVYSRSSETGEDDGLKYYVPPLSAGHVRSWQLTGAPIAPPAKSTGTSVFVAPTEREEMFQSNLGLTENLPVIPMQTTLGKTLNSYETQQSCGSDHLVVPVEREEPSYAQVRKPPKEVIIEAEVIRPEQAGRTVVEQYQQQQDMPVIISHIPDYPEEDNKPLIHIAADDQQNWPAAEHTSHVKPYFGQAWGTASEGENKVHAGYPADPTNLPAPELPKRPDLLEVSTTAMLVESSKPDGSTKEAEPRRCSVVSFKSPPEKDTPRKDPNQKKNDGIRNDPDEMKSAQSEFDHEIEHKRADSFTTSTPARLSKPPYTTGYVVSQAKGGDGSAAEGMGCCGYILTAFSYLIVLITIPFSLFLCIKVVQEYERAVIFRLGRCVQGGAKGPGLFFILPCIDTYMQVDMRTISFDVPPQEVLTKDSVTVAVDAVVYYRIANATASVTNVEDCNKSTRLLAATTLRNTLGTKSLADLLAEREAVSHQMQTTLDEATDPWGVKVERVEIKDVRLPVQLQRAMAAEAEASREARAKVIAAEGEMKASRALKEASDIIHESPSALQLRYLQTLNTISAEKNSTIIFPLPIEFMRGFMDQ